MKYSLRLFISGESLIAQRAISNIQSICSMEDIEFSFQIIDLAKNPEQAEFEKILATPTLIKDQPHPPQRIIGDLSDRDKLYELLGFSKSK